jgi:hypothetical protein
MSCALDIVVAMGASCVGCVAWGLCCVRYALEFGLLCLRPSKVCGVVLCAPGILNASAAALHKRGHRGFVPSGIANVSGEASLWSSNSLSSGAPIAAIGSAWSTHYLANRFLRHAQTYVVRGLLSFGRPGGRAGGI